MKPKLRFKEFTDDWEEKKLGEVFQYQKEKINIDNDFDKYVSTENLLSEFRGISFPNYSNDNKAIKFQKNNILMGNIRPYLNKIWLANCDGGASNDVNVFKVFDLYDVQFVYYLIANERFTNKVMLTATGTKMPRGDKKAILEFQYHIPSLPEQEKIGKFFSLLDQRIEKQERKVALLEEEKKGYMQQIFNQELRFKDEEGNNYPDWKEKKLGEIAESFDYGIGASAIEYDGKHKYIRITDIDDKTHKFIENDLKSPNESDETILEQYKVNENDILFARTGATTGKTYLYNSEDEDLYFAGFLIRAHIIKEIANSYFIYSQTLLSNYNKWVRIMSMRTGQPGINAQQYKKLSIQLPSLPEQEKIANFLSLLDQRIEKEQEKLRLLKEEKKGLLQQMFV